MDPDVEDYDDFPMSLEYDDEDPFVVFDRDTDWAEDHAYLGQIGEQYMMRHRDDY